MLSDGDHLVGDGPQKLDRALRDFYPGASWNQVRNAIRSGKVSVDDVVTRDETCVVERGARVAVRMAAPRHPPAPNLDDAIVHLDAHVVVVRKPSGVATVPDERRRRGTLVQLVRAQIKQRQPLHVVQRLDLGTSGLIVFARTEEAYAPLKEQFQKRTIERSYLALVMGRVAKDTTIRSYLTEFRDGTRKSTRHRNSGKYACTHVAVVGRGDEATLVRCVLETGRTHQIRIHLSEAGHPLIGDKRYARRDIAAPSVLPPSQLASARLMLHAATLGFEHPTDGGALRFEQPMPEEMKKTARACGVKEV